MTAPADRQRWGTRTSAGWVIGHIGGAPLLLSPSWFLIAAVLALLFLPTVSLRVPGLGTIGALLAAAGFPLMLLVSVLAHEVAHGLTGRRVGSPPSEYVLTLWGGHTQFRHELATPGTSAAVSVAGPVANAVLAVAAWGLLVATPVTGFVELLLQAATVANGVVAAFNLLPGLPLDGGRVLEALVWKVTGDRLRGTVAAGWGGRAVVIGLVVVFVLRPLGAGARPSLVTMVWVAVLGAYLWSAASRTIATARAYQAAAGLDLRALADPARVMAAGTSLAHLDTLAAPGAVVLTDEAHRITGLVDPEAAAQVPPAARGTTTLSAVATALPQTAVVTVMEGARAAGAVAHAARTSALVVLVDGARGVVGVLPVRRLEEALSSRRPRRTA
ncbi:site-2 protease family protein [Georgenia faecalis]|uniref:site-2 protease family protein n=1 Tax=Georgenia faecalis TaxID=2483799 RepID=UPI000FD7DC35|nr:site-2 protease family protein [Georgenia faecalis]